MTIGEKAVVCARRRLNAPYKFGAKRTAWDDPLLPLDCSGLTTVAYGEAGYSIPHGSYNQAKVIIRKDLTKSLSTPGALFFKRKFGIGPVSHVGMALGDGENIIEANGYYGKVIIRPFKAGKWNFWGVVPGSV